MAIIEYVKNNHQNMSNQEIINKYEEARELNHNVPFLDRLFFQKILNKIELLMDLVF